MRDTFSFLEYEVFCIYPHSSLFCSDFSIPIFLICFNKLTYFNDMQIIKEAKQTMSRSTEVEVGGRNAELKTPHSAKSLNTILSHVFSTLRGIKWKIRSLALK